MRDRIRCQGLAQGFDHSRRHVFVVLGEGEEDLALHMRGESMGRVRLQGPVPRFDRSRLLVRGMTSAASLARLLRSAEARF
jgi:hypothetical protein